MMNPINGAFQFGTINVPTAILLGLVVSATHFEAAGDTGNRKNRGQAHTFGDNRYRNSGRQKKEIDKSEEQKCAFPLFFDVVTRSIHNLGKGSKFGVQQIHYFNNAFLSEHPDGFGGLGLSHCGVRLVLFIGASASTGGIITFHLRGNASGKILGTYTHRVVGHGYYVMNATVFGALSSTYLDGERCTMTHKYDGTSSDGDSRSIFVVDGWLIQ